MSGIDISGLNKLEAAVQVQLPDRGANHQMIFAIDTGVCEATQQALPGV